ncbi:MAG: hypothetical protein LBS98_04890 [Coriobacteriales bacterium]|jgi:hypothetical protein|nr:hypothetical protein [Coriobacteriales bacterium]
MVTRKHALLFFSKPPIPGSVKLRLTKEGGGPFTQTETAELYRRSMFDVAELCCLAMHDLEQENSAERAANANAPVQTYDFFVSTTPASNIDVMRQAFEEIGAWPRPFTYISDRGRTVGAHLDDAFQQLFDLGYDSVLCVVPDVPLLPREHVLNGFRWLQHLLEASEKGGIVQAPNQNGFAGLIGWTRTAEIDHYGVPDDEAGRPALDRYLERAVRKKIPFITLPPVNSWGDSNEFAQTTSLARAVQYSQQFQPDLYVPIRFLAWVDWRGIRVGAQLEN